jgi:hypothetical protein
MSGICAKLHVVGLGLAIGILSAVYVFILGLFAMRGYGVDYVHLAGSIYVGYAPTFLGSLVGAIWAFIHGFIGGVIIAWLYNCFSRSCHRGCDTTKAPYEPNKMS